MHFYNRIVFISYFVKPKMFTALAKGFTCRMLDLTLEHGVSKYSATCLVCYAMTRSTKEGYRIGKMAISLLQRFDAVDQIPSIYLCFYGHVAIYVEPLQVSERVVIFLFLFWLSRFFTAPHFVFIYVLFQSCTEM